MTKPGSLLALLILGGCASAPPGVDRPQPQALTMKQWITGVDKDGTLGEMDLGKYTSGSEMLAQTGLMKDAEPVIMLGVKHDKLCFAKVEDGDAGERETDEQYYASARYAVLTFESLDEVTPQTPWPEPAADKLVEATAATRRKPAACAGNPGPDLGGRECDRDQLEVNMTLCIPAPTIPATAHYVALALVFPAGSTNRNMLPIWRITGAEASPP